MTAPNLENVKQALDTVQNNLDLFDHEQAKTLQEGIDLWCFAPRMLKLIKAYIAATTPLQRAECHKTAHELIKHIES